MKPPNKKVLTEKQKIYKKYLLSHEWASLKIDLFNHRGKACEKCNSKTKIQVHHLHYNNIFKEEPEDLIILCAKCHQKEHNHIKKPKKVIKRKPKKLKILSLAKKLELKKTNKKAFKKYVKKLNSINLVIT